MVDRRERARRGAVAERIAAEYLQAAGMTVLERNLRVGRFEIDLLARDGPVVVIVEVRTRGRGSWQGALASVDGAKQRRLRNAGALLWARRLAARADVERLRFDVIAVDLHDEARPQVEHIRSAF